MFRIRKRFTFEAAHQLLDAYSKDCSLTIHGHSYIVEVFLVSQGLDQMGMVLDFGLLKPAIDDIKARWDHALLLPRSLLKTLSAKARWDSKIEMFPNNMPPTAEVMAQMLFNHFSEYIDGLLQQQTRGGLKMRIEKVRIHETETGWAEYQREER